MDAEKFFETIIRMERMLGYSRLPHQVATVYKAVRIAETWDDEHPAKTRLQDFLDKFPDVELGVDGYPIISPSSLGYCGKGVKCRDCEYHGIRRTKECWDMPLEE